MKDIIIVFEKQLKAGLHEGTSIPLSTKDYSQFDYNDFQLHDPREGLDCGILISKVKLGKRLEKWSFMRIFLDRPYFPRG